MSKSSARGSPAEHRILICDELDAAALDVFRERGLEPQVQTGKSEAELLALVPGVHALVVRSATKITRAVLEAGTELRVVGRAGVGVDNVDCDAATERGIVVMNTPTGNTTTTGELAIALLCALARHIARADRSTRKGSWAKKGLTGTEITGKTLGVVGLGRIGKVVADRALGLKMNVVAHDPYLGGGAVSGIAGVELVELDTLLAESDFVTLHVPLTDATRNLISKDRIARMKKGARLINAARGGLVDEAALLAALESGQLAGAALDVLSEEPPPKDHPLLAREEVIVTPHLGASSHEAQFNVAVDIAHQVCEFLLDGVAHNAVNAPAVSASTLREVAPYVLLAEKIGSFLGQWHTEPIAKIELVVSGEIATKDYRHVPLALLTSILRQGMDAGVNFVNAPLFAKERGLLLLESAREEEPVYHSKIWVRTTARDDEEAHVACGTVFGRTPKLVEVDGMRLDLDTKGPILVTRHEDRPGVVGLLGTVLGSHGVNIRRIELGPPGDEKRGDEKRGDGKGGDGERRTGLATGFLSLYSAPAAEVIAHIGALEPVRQVRLIRL